MLDGKFIVIYLHTSK